MTINKALHGIDEKYDAVNAARRLALPNRAHKNYRVHFDAHTPEDLKKGVWMMISLGEGNYKNQQGMIAKEGTLKLMFVYHVKLDEKTRDQEDLRAEEFAAIEELKTFCRAGVTGLSLQPNNIVHSGQLEFPIGWVVANVDAGPPQAGTH